MEIKETYQTGQIDEKCLAMVLHGMPAPRLENLKAMAVKIAIQRMGNKSDAADYLGISKRTMRNWTNG